MGKRSIKLALIFVIAVNILVACKKNVQIYERYYGTWYANGCVSNGGPFNCGYPYPIPRDENITLVLKEDKTFIQTSGTTTVQGTYEIQKAQATWSGSDVVFDKLTRVSGGQITEGKIEITADGDLRLLEKVCCSVFYYSK